VNNTLPDRRGFMKRNKVYIITTVALVLMLVFIPVSSDQYIAAASEAYQKTESSSGVITANDVNLRNGPSTKFDIICKLKKDQKVTVMGKLGDWYAVYVSGTGNVGAVYSQYLKPDKPKSTNTKQVSAQNKTDTATKDNKNQTKSTTSAKTNAAASKTNTAASKTNTAASKNNSTKTTEVQEFKDVTKEEKELFDLVNKAREEKGLKPLKFDADLVKIARLKAKDMKENSYFSHTSKTYGTPFDMMKKYGVKFSTAGENIAGNQSAEKVVKAWLKEESNNIYNGKFTYTGIGIVESPIYGKLYVQLFIKK